MPGERVSAAARAGPAALRRYPFAVAWWLMSGLCSTVGALVSGWATASMARPTAYVVVMRGRKRRLSRGRMTTVAR